MDFNLLFSVILYILIGGLLLLSFRIFVAIKWEARISQKNYLNLQERLVFEKNLQEQVLQKNRYLENYHKELFNKLFELTKELLLTKKIILEERYN